MALSSFIILPVLYHIAIIFTTGCRLGIITIIHMIQSSERFTTKQLYEMLSVAERAAGSVGDVLAANIGAKDIGKIVAGSHSSLTHWDAWAQEKIVRVLEKVDSDIGISAEEGLHSSNNEIYWVIDPIDGTYWYTKGDGRKCHTAIALVERVICTLCDTPHEVTVPVVSTMFNFSSGVHHSAINTGMQQHSEHRLGSVEHISLEYYGDDSVEAETTAEMLRCKVGRALIANLACSYSMISIASGRQDALIIDDNPFTGEHDLAPGALYVVSRGGEARSNSKLCFSTTTPFAKHSLGSHIISAGTFL